MTGSCSSTGSQPTGGEAGGEMRNCLVAAGGCKCGDDDSDGESFG